MQPGLQSSALTDVGNGSLVSRRVLRVLPEAVFIPLESEEAADVYVYLFFIITAVPFYILCTCIAHFVLAVGEKFAGAGGCYYPHVLKLSFRSVDTKHIICNWSMFASCEKLGRGDARLSRVIGASLGDCCTVCVFR